MDRSLGLLDRVQRIIGCEYLSSLRNNSYWKSILAVISTFHVSDYKYQEWAEALSYIFNEIVEIENETDLEEFIEKKNSVL